MTCIVKPDFIQEKISLKPHNSFRFDALAAFYAQIFNLDQLKSAIEWANSNSIPISMIGEGSNLLLTGDLDALVLINCLKGISLSRTDACVEVLVSAGENWHEVVTFAIENDLSGIENLALIPGTAGAAPVQNIGAYGVEIKDALSRVQVLDRANGELLWIEAEDCGFAYRDSHFKGKWTDKYFITAICLELNLVHEVKVSYGGLAEGLPSEPTIKQVFDRVCSVRSSKLPDPKLIGNAGSFFKNPIVTNLEYQRVSLDYPDLVAFSFEGGWKLAAGWMIDKAGWKGVSQNGVGVYEKQALCLVNHDAQKADALLKLEQEIKLDIKQKFGVVLEREPVQLGKMPLI
ncbi:MULTISPECIES: UDP-N-acetylmuramate dehydrogenase [unclassified Marinomonas]|uniref:UDP-N-acetylmuramate dehydrogenase n=1 Tax=unclassified Marinomonas TaxID=196814 RepID=UPI0007AF83B4|nr:MULTISPECIES: UDP-N-acetylmuramate dehydrogenase [unclassified Marinomonas]